MKPDGFNMQEETWYFTGHLITQLKHFPLLYVRNICERQRGTNTLEIESVFWHIVFYKLNLFFSEHNSKRFISFCVWKELSLG